MQSRWDTVGGALQIGDPVAVPEGAVVLPARSDEASVARANAILPMRASQIPKPPRPMRGVGRPRSKTVEIAVPVAIDDLAALDKKTVD